MENNLISVPRVESRAPNKNTIEWEIPNKVLVTWMLIDRVGYTIIVKLNTKKKHWWNRSSRKFMINGWDPAKVIIKGVDFLEKYGYTIDSNTIKFGENIGNLDR